jgi:PPK2 family polyphosphate:nucleotide phosphotransferase
MNFDRYRVDGKEGLDLDKHDPADLKWCDQKKEARKRLAELKEELAELQRRLYANNEHGLLMVLQAMDAGGKDGAIRKVMSGVNPQGCHVSSFKAPSAVEANHDYLWRIHHSIPARGRFVIFNRSHYEDVIIARVHADQILPEWAKGRKHLWAERIEQINQFERHLAQNNIVILKFFLHISKDEQKKRLQARLEDPAANWKFSSNDLAERAHWDDYQKAFEQALSRTSTDWAPWYVVPANHKWYRDLVIAEVLVATLQELKLEYPKADPEMLKGIVIE